MSGSTPSREHMRRALARVPTEAQLRGVRRAAVAVVLLDLERSLEVLLIERAIREGDPWSGHMALPGGHEEPGDADLAATAERETLEEVGLDLTQAGERLGRLSDSTPVRGVPLSVRPYVYALDARPVLLLSAEVEHAVWVPTEPLRSGQRQTAYSMSRGGQSLKFPAWDVSGRVVWGLTYRVLEELFTRLNELSSLG